MTYTRRHFLRTASAAGLASPLLLNSFGNAANVTGYKALVCLFLLGGLDTHDVLIPVDQPSYDQYAGIRQSLLDQHGQSRAQSSLLALNPVNSADYQGRQFGLAPEMPKIKTLFDQGNAAIVPNVGPLIEPTTLAQLEAESVKLPPRLFSHNDQQSTWQTSSPEGAQLGWGGLFADAALAFSANGQPAFTTVTALGNDVFLTGQTATPYQLTLGDEVLQVDVLAQLEQDRGNSPEAEAAYQSLLQHFRPDMFNGTNLLQRDIASASVDSIDANALFANATQNAPALFTSFPATPLGKQLAGVAKTIQVRSTLQAARQVFFVGYGGFDTHSGQATDLPQLLRDIDDAVSAFNSAMIELGTNNGVTLFTASDFGRTLAINGDGTDHGWGSHHFVVGGAVNGNQIYGDVPPPVFGHPNDVGGGRLLPAIAVDQYAATMGRWFGLNNAELAAALPNLGNFATSDLGFL